jgi:hypothetical protein
MPLRKVEAKKLPLGIYTIVIILFILATYFIFLGASFWHEYYFNPSVMNSSQLDMNSKLEAQGLPNLNQLTAWAGLIPALTLSLFIILVGIFLLCKKNWARWILIVISLFFGLISLLITISNWTNLPYAVFGLTMGIYLLISRKVRLAFISNKKQREIKKENQKLSGLGGWLILLQIFFIENALSYLVWIILILVGQIYSSYPQAWILVLFLLSSIAFVLNCYVIFLMYQKRKSFVFYAQVFLYYDIVLTFLLFDIFLSIINLITISIIIYYLKKSRRVNNTFIKK